jgi:hypothetical protein
MRNATVLMDSKGGYGYERTLHDEGVKITVEPVQVR